VFEVLAPPRGSDGKQDSDSGSGIEEYILVLNGVVIPKDTGQTKSSNLFQQELFSRRIESRGLL